MRLSSEGEPGREAELGRDPGSGKAAWGVPHAIAFPSLGPGVFISKMETQLAGIMGGHTRVTLIWGSLSHLGRGR